MQAQETVLIVRADEVGRGSRRGYPLAHFSYRLGEGPHLYRMTQGVQSAGGLMMVGEGKAALTQASAALAHEFVTECRRRAFRGVILDLESKPTAPLASLLSELDRLLYAEGLSFYVPLSYANFVSQARLMISTALSGGVLRQRLSHYVEHYGAARMTLCITRCAEEFHLPAQSGSGLRLTQEALAALRAAQNAHVFFSRELCCQYFSFASAEHGLCFVLFDDIESLREKRTVGESLGISSFFYLFAETESIWEALS